MYLSIWCSVLHLQLEIKNHVFFTPINWDDLYHKRMTPPYNPNVVSEWTCLWMCGFLVCFKSLKLHSIKNFLQRGPADIQHIDPEFTREMVSSSVSRTPEFTASAGASSSASNAFNGFSFVATEHRFLWDGSGSLTRRKAHHTVWELWFELFLYRCNLSPHDLYWTLQGLCLLKIRH